MIHFSSAFFSRKTYPHCQILWLSWSPSSFWECYSHGGHVKCFGYNPKNRWGVWFKGKRLNKKIPQKYSLNKKNTKNKINSYFLLLPSLHRDLGSTEQEREGKLKLASIWTLKENWYFRTTSNLLIWIKLAKMQGYWGREGVL